MSQLRQKSMPQNNNNKEKYKAIFAPHFVQIKKNAVLILMTLYSGCLADWINGPATERLRTIGQKT